MKITKWLLGNFSIFSLLLQSFKNLLLDNLMWFYDEKLRDEGYRKAVMIKKILSGRNNDKLWQNQRWHLKTKNVGYTRITYCWMEKLQRT
jgi:hypothetical protein